MTASRPLARGDIVLVRYPFTDLSGAKVRPALIVGRVRGPDLILAFMTSQVGGPTTPSTCLLAPPDPEFGATGLKGPSAVHLGTPATLQLGRDRAADGAARERGVASGTGPLTLPRGRRPSRVGRLETRCDGVAGCSGSVEERKTVDRIVVTRIFSLVEQRVMMPHVAPDLGRDRLGPVVLVCGSMRMAMACVGVGGTGSEVGVMLRPSADDLAVLDGVIAALAEERPCSAYLERATARAAVGVDGRRRYKNPAINGNSLPPATKARPCHQPTPHR